MKKLVKVKLAPMTKGRRHRVDTASTDKQVDDIRPTGLALTSRSTKKVGTRLGSSPCLLACLICILT
jgi:hypothetical protein